MHLPAAAPVDGRLRSSGRAEAEVPGRRRRDREQARGRRSTEGRPARPGVLALNSLIDGGKLRDGLCACVSACGRAPPNLDQVGGGGVRLIDRRRSRNPPGDRRRSMAARPGPPGPARSRCRTVRTRRSPSEQHRGSVPATTSEPGARCRHAADTACHRSIDTDSRGPGASRRLRTRWLSL